MPRAQRPHKCSWDGKLIQGLYKCPDGRWRINATGKKFTEPDERRAVQRFQAWEATQADTVTLAVPSPDPHDTKAVLEKLTRPRKIRISVPADYADYPTEHTIGREVDADEIWPWLREMLIMHPEYIAKMTGIPELVGLRHLPLPKKPIKLADLIAVYKRENPSTDKSKREAVAVLDRLIDHAEARTVDDLTQEKLTAFRRSIESSGALQSAGTRKGYYGRIKTIIGFGLKVGLDQQQIRDCLDRCKVLWTAEAMPAVNPQPINREHFHKLLGTGNGSWRPWLLLGLNLAMYVEELCDLKWASFNLERGTYAAIREKTKRDRIPRAAVLWPETIAALKALPRKGPYVFTSSHGTRYNKNTRINDFAELRTAAGLPDTLKFSHLRDGAYTAACQGTTDERLARVLAGHKAAGLQDNYVLRSPEIVRPACEAVYKVYGPFATP